MFDLAHHQALAAFHWGRAQCFFPADYQRLFEEVRRISPFIESPSLPSDACCLSCSSSGFIEQGRNMGALWCTVKRSTRGPHWVCDVWTPENSAFHDVKSAEGFDSGSVCNTRSLCNGLHK